MLWQTASETHSRPSSLLDIEDKLVAYIFDTAVVTFGHVIENALNEQVNRGTPDKPTWEAKYTLEQLLSHDFHLPYERKRKKVPADSKFSNFADAPGIAQVLALAAEGARGIKRWEYKPN